MTKVSQQHRMKDQLRALIAGMTWWTTNKATCTPDSLTVSLLQPDATSFGSHCPAIAKANKRPHVSVSDVAFGTRLKHALRRHPP
ncbi:hypothetical protein [Micromonospora sp. NPDC047187]|uniref:hypothetical protein n=1 Tax=Micromonospora sp. NPDC047187 TaxID=3155262 RepID=UPI00340A4EA0